MGYNMSKQDIFKKEKAADKQLLSRKTSKEFEEIKLKITKILKKNKVKRAGIFGSFSRGKQKKNSDIDIAVKIEDNNMSLFGFIRLIRLLENALKRKVDLVEYSAIKPGIKERISNEEIRII